MGEKQKVLITEESHDGVHYVAHNKSYDQVRLWVIQVRHWRTRIAHGGHPGGQTKHDGEQLKKNWGLETNRTK